MGKFNIFKKWWVILLFILLVVGIFYFMFISNSVEKVTCEVIYDNGRQIFDSCIDYNPQSFCNTGVTSYDESVRSGGRLEFTGFCKVSGGSSGWGI